MSRKILIGITLAAIVLLAGVYLSFFAKRPSTDERQEDQFATLVAENDCSAALITSVYSSNWKWARDWRLSQFVSEKAWTSFQQDAKIDKLFDLPISGSASTYLNYSKDLVTSSNESLTEEEAQNIFWTGLSKESEGAYRQCLESSRKLHDGIHLSVDDATDELIHLNLHYSPKHTPDSISVQWTYPKIGAVKLPTKIVRGDNLITVPRPQKRTLLEAVWDGERSGMVALLPLPKELPKAPCIETDADGKCLKCLEFDQAIPNLSDGQYRPFFCLGMPANTKVWTRAWGVAAPLRGGGGNIIISLMGADGTSFPGGSLGGQQLLPEAGQFRPFDIRTDMFTLGAAGADVTLKLYVVKCESDVGTACTLQHTNVLTCSANSSCPR